MMMGRRLMGAVSAGGSFSTAQHCMLCEVTSLDARW